MTTAPELLHLAHIIFPTVTVLHRLGQVSWELKKTAQDLVTEDE